MSKPHVIAVIHARGGSKRVPLKNIKAVGGRPLIAWCIEAALTAKSLDRIIVSTDHDGIAEVALQAGAEVPFRRPAALSEDVASELVTRHGVEFHEQQTGHVVDIAVTIQPTTPFLRSRDIDGCVAMLANDPHIDSSFTMTSIQHRPEWSFRRAGATRLQSYVREIIKGDRGVSQSLEPLFHPNGGAYATRRQTLFRDGLVIGPKPGGWEMSRLRSVDVDDPVDMVVAEAIAGYLAEHPDE
ncbi:MAG: acylneuraminate cytidylyltransferase family protein [Rhodospirillales bacterium]|nr:acylneuraminate cytidylyltransferase family protein [Rhodospirillales bacterium]